VQRGIEDDAAGWDYFVNLRHHQRGSDRPSSSVQFNIPRIDPGAAERATEARREADRLAVEAWNKRMLDFRGPAQPSPRWATRSVAVALSSDRFHLTTIHTKRRTGHPARS